MGNRYAMTVNGAGSTVTYRRWLEVGNNLMTIQIEIDPRRVAPTLSAAQDVAVEFPRQSQVVDWKGEMKIGYHKYLSGL